MPGRFNLCRLESKKFEPTKRQWARSSRKTVPALAISRAAVFDGDGAAPDHRRVRPMLLEIVANRRVGHRVRPAAAVVHHPQRGHLDKICQHLPSSAAHALYTWTEGVHEQIGSSCIGTLAPVSGYRQCHAEHPAATAAGYWSSPSAPRHRPAARALSHKLSSSPPPARQVYAFTTYEDQHRTKSNKRQ